MMMRDRVVPEWQDLKVGDQLNLAPEVGLGVAVVEQGRALVLRGGVPMGATPPPYDFTWAFVLREQPDGTTRLLVRERYASTQRWAGFLVEPVAMVSFVMSQRMLRGIRDRAERGGRPTACNGRGWWQGHLAQPARREVELGLPGLLRRFSPSSESHRQDRTHPRRAVPPHLYDPTQGSRSPTSPLVPSSTPSPVGPSPPGGFA